MLPGEAPGDAPCFRGVHTWCIGLGDRREHRSFALSTKTFFDFIEARSVCVRALGRVFHLCMYVRMCVCMYVYGAGV